MSDHTSRPALDVLFIWHLHQPYYGLPGDDEFILPWVRLHAVKSYYDMARVLEQWPEVRATFNFSGSLLRQLVEVVDHGRRDRWWRWSRTAPDALEGADRRNILRHFFSISHEQGVAPLPRFANLLQRRSDHGIADCAESFSAQEMLDLQVLFNLAWCGFSARDDFPLIDELRSKGADFTVEERDALLDLHIEIAGHVLPLYRKLADRDQIEISVSPMYHPIIPLLIDTETAARPSPDRPRPSPYRAGDDAQLHITEALDLAESIFGSRPTGMWPSEGSVSPEALELFTKSEVSWIATDEDVLRLSRAQSWNRHTDLWKSWTCAGKQWPKVYFRDHGLSDLIGFVYSDNPANEAADDLMAKFSDIHSDLGDKPGSVSIILDGENPWEHYDDDGRPFLNALYERLERSNKIRTNFPSALSGRPSGQLETLYSGSWIMANYQIWIGHEETNTAWEWLRRAHDQLRDIAADSPDHPGLSQAHEALRMAQGSDWFWWYGDDFGSEQDDQFDSLFRSLVAAVWTHLEQTPPAELTIPIHHNSSLSSNELQITPPRRFITPTIDGRIGDYFDWIGSGRILIAGGHGSMYETLRPLNTIHYGFSRQNLYLRLEPGPDFSDHCHFEVHLKTDDLRFEIAAGPEQQVANFENPEAIIAVFGGVADFLIPLHLLELGSGDSFEIVVSVHREGLQIQRFPAHEMFTLQVPCTDPSNEYWMV